jgi:hypothetical protein
MPNLLGSHLGVNRRSDRYRECAKSEVKPGTNSEANNTPRAKQFKGCQNMSGYSRIHKDVTEI